MDYFGFNMNGVPVYKSTYITGPKIYKSKDYLGNEYIVMGENMYNKVSKQWRNIERRNKLKKLNNET